MGRKRYTYEEVKAFIENEGYKLLSDEYVNSHTKLRVKCPKGHEYEVKYYSFFQGKRCRICSGSAKHTYKEVKRYIESFGYTLLSRKYKDNKTKLKVVCPQNHKYSVSFKQFKRGVRCKTCYLNNKFGKNNSNWRGGVWEKNLPLYDTYASQIDFCEEVRRDPKNKNLLQVKCYESNCRKWFTPELKDVARRVQAIKGNLTGEQHFYCSDKCKHNCSIFKKHKYPEGFKDNHKREVQPELRQLVFERDDYECQKCGDMRNLECHHITPVSLDPLESADIDNCITLCKQCHKEVHQQLGCTYSELKKVC